MDQAHSNGVFCNFVWPLFPKLGLGFVFWRSFCSIFARGGKPKHHTRDVEHICFHSIRVSRDLSFGYPEHSNWQRGFWQYSNFTSFTHPTKQTKKAKKQKTNAITV
jgi:hypothetical protein